MKKTCAISLNTKKEFSLYKMSNKYTEQNVKNVYKVAQNWTACLIKHTVHIKVKLNRKNV